MQPPRLFAALPLLDRFTLPRYSTETLAGLIKSGNVTPRRLEAVQWSLGPVAASALLRAVMDGVRPRAGVESLSGLDEVTRERLQVQVAEDRLGSNFVARTVQCGAAEDALPFLRWGSRIPAMAAVIAINYRESEDYGFPLERTLVQQAADAILDRGGEDLTRGGPTTLELARYVRSRALFEEILTATDRALSSEQPGVVARAARGEVALFEMMTNIECQPYGKGGRDSAAARQQRLRTLAVTASWSTIEAAWRQSGESVEEAGAVLDALGRAAIIAYARSNRSEDIENPDCVRETLTVAEKVVRSLVARSADDASIESLYDAESLKTLRDAAIGLRANSHAPAHLGWSRHLSATRLLPYNTRATSFLTLTDAWRLKDARQKHAAGVPPAPTALAATSETYDARRVADSVAVVEQRADVMPFAAGPVLPFVANEVAPDEDEAVEPGASR